MATIKVFDSKGVKTLEFLGNANEQAYDDPFVFDEEDDGAPEDTEAPE